MDESHTRWANEWEVAQLPLMLTCVYALLKKRFNIEIDLHLLTQNLIQYNLMKNHFKLESLSRLLKFRMIKIKASECMNKNQQKMKYYRGIFVANRWSVSLKDKWPPDPLMQHPRKHWEKEKISYPNYPKKVGTYKVKAGLHLHALRSHLLRLA